MKIATFDAGGLITYGIVRDGGVVDAGARLGSKFPDLQSVLVADAMGELEKLAVQATADYVLKDIRLLKPIIRPGKILCVGLNYPVRNAEYKDNSEPPKYPSIFVRFPSFLVAHEE